MVSVVFHLDRTRTNGLQDEQVNHSWKQWGLQMCSEECFALHVIFIVINVFTNKKRVGKYMEK